MLYEVITAHFSRAAGEELAIVESVIRVNERQRERMVAKIVAALDGNVDGRTIGVLGLSFKPETDDVRDAPSLDIIRGLEKRGARIRAYDPHAMQEASKLLPNLVTCSDVYRITSYNVCYTKLLRYKYRGYSFRFTHRRANCLVG